MFSGFQCAILFAKYNSFSYILGHNFLMVGMMGPQHPCEEICVHHLGRNKYTVKYLVRDHGNYVLVIKWGDDHVPGSPFHVAIQ